MIVTESSTEDDLPVASGRQMAEADYAMGTDRGVSLSRSKESETGSRTRTADVRCFGDRWAYRSVMAGDVWPSNVLTVASGTPFMTSQEANVCRRS